MEWLNAEQIKILDAFNATEVGCDKNQTVVSLFAALGALKAGCAYQPLEPTYPPERLNFMIKDAAAKVLGAVGELLASVGYFSA